MFAALAMLSSCGADSVILRPNSSLVPASRVIVLDIRVMSSTVPSVALRIRCKMSGPTSIVRIRRSKDC